jgi:hypothetical protein
MLLLALSVLFQSFPELEKIDLTTYVTDYLPSSFSCLLMREISSIGVEGVISLFIYLSKSNSVSEWSCLLP